MQWRDKGDEMSDSQFSDQKLCSLLFSLVVYDE